VTPMKDSNKPGNSNSPSASRSQYRRGGRERRTALDPEPFDLVEGVIPSQSRILEASLHVAERLASYIFDQGLARARYVDAVRTWLIAGGRQIRTFGPALRSSRSSRRFCQPFQHFPFRKG